MNCLSLKSVKNTWQKSLTILDNHYVNLSLVIVLILYCSQIFGNINSIISNLYQYNFVKLLLLLTIAYVGPKDTNIAVLLAISYVISLRNNKNSLIENFTNDNEEFNNKSLIIAGNPKKTIITEEDAISVINILTIYKKRLNQKHFGFDMKQQKYINTYNYFMDCLIYLIVNATRLRPYTIILVAEYFGKQAMLINFNFVTKKEIKAPPDNKSMDNTSYQGLKTFMEANKRYRYNNQIKNFGIINKNTADAKILLSLISSSKDKPYFGLNLTNENNLTFYNYSFESLVYIMANQEFFTTTQYALAIEIFGLQSNLINLKMTVK